MLWQITAHILVVGNEHGGVRFLSVTKESIKDKLKKTWRIFNKDERNPTVTVMGGDLREKVLMQRLLEHGFNVKSFARPPEMIPEEAVFCENAREALSDVIAVVFPMAGLSSDGLLHSKGAIPCYLYEEDFELLAPGTLMLTGIESSYLAEIAQKRSLKLMSMAERDEVAIPNAIPTAEGAIAVAIEKSQGLLQGSTGLIIGYGRVSQALAPRLAALGMNLLIANRGEQRAQLAREQGYQVIPWSQWPAVAKDVDFIFNTVPYLLFTEAVLASLSPQTLLVDLSAIPGGADFAAASRLGVNAVLASGLPGKYSPLAAGEILANVYVPLFEKLLEEEAGEEGRAQ